MVRRPGRPDTGLPVALQFGSAPGRGSGVPRLPILETRFAEGTEDVGLEPRAGQQAQDGDLQPADPTHPSENAGTASGAEQHNLHADIGRQAGDGSHRVHSIKGAEYVFHFPALNPEHEPPPQAIGHNPGQNHEMIPGIRRVEEENPSGRKHAAHLKQRCAGALPMLDDDIGRSKIECLVPEGQRLSQCEDPVRHHQVLVQRRIHVGPNEQAAPPGDGRLLSGRAGPIREQLAAASGIEPPGTWTDRRVQQRDIAALGVREIDAQPARQPATMPVPKTHSGGRRAAGSARLAGH